MSQILYINILVDWSLSDIMTSKHVTRESESPRHAASSILISRMTRSSVIIPYVNGVVISCGARALVCWALSRATIRILDTYNIMTTDALSRDGISMTSNKVSCY